MDRRERVPPGTPNKILLDIKAALEDNQANIWTALPAYVTKYTSAKLTVEAQATIQAQIRQPDGSWISTTLPVCSDCPVLFPGGGGFTLTFPIAEGNEGLLIFASRCIDAWWQQGGVQKQAELRMHDLSDGFFIPTGGMSNPNVPLDVSTTAVELRSKDGTSVLVHLDNDLIVLSLANGTTSLTVDNSAGKVDVVAENGLWVNGVMVVVP
jgi:hypothetical protein